MILDKETVGTRGQGLDEHEVSSTPLFLGASVGATKAVFAVEVNEGADRRELHS